MTKRIRAYIAYIEGLLAELEAGKNRECIDKIKAEHLVQIGFFQHERLIHLIVTVLFAILEFMSFFACLIVTSLGTILLAGAVLVLLIPYIKHYFLLENEVQRMYKQYDKMCSFEENERSTFL